MFMVCSLFFLKSCGQDSKIDTEQLNIEYTTFTRGSFMLITVNHETIKKTTDRNLKSFTSKKCQQKEWNTILEYSEAIEWKQLPDLKAPTGKRLYDGAPHASLKITYKDQVYKSSSFDHGAPPEEIKSLVAYIVSLAETVE